MTYAVTGIELA